MQRAAGAVAAACVLLSAGGTVLQWWRTASEATTAAGREHGRCHGALTVITIEAFTQMVESGVRLWQRAQLPLVRRGLVPHANLSESMLHPCFEEAALGFSATSHCAQLLQVDRQERAGVGGDEVHASDQEAARCFTQSALLAGVLLQRQRLDSDEMQELAEAVLVVAVRALGDVGWVKPEWALWPRLLPFADLLHWILDDISGVPVTPLESLLAWGIGMGRDGPESGGSALSGMRELGAAAASLHESGDATTAIFIEATATGHLEQRMMLDASWVWLLHGDGTGTGATATFDQEAVLRANLAASRAWLTRLRGRRAFAALRPGIGWHAFLYRKVVGLHADAAFALEDLLISTGRSVEADETGRQAKWELAEAARRGALEHAEQSPFGSRYKSRWSAPWALQPSALVRPVPDGRPASTSYAPRGWFEGDEHEAIQLARDELVAHAVVIREATDTLHSLDPDWCRVRPTEPIVRRLGAAPEEGGGVGNVPAAAWQQCLIASNSQVHPAVLAAASRERAVADVVAMVRRLHSRVHVSAVKLLRVKGGAHIRSHVGVDNVRIRHLLTLRDGCGDGSDRTAAAGRSCVEMRVGWTDPARGFVEGSVLSFDDSFWHSVTSRASGSYREVLMVETLNPLLTPPSLVVA